LCSANAPPEPDAELGPPPSKPLPAGRQVHPPTSIFEGLPPSMPVWMSHGDRIVDLPPGFRALAHSDSSPIAAMTNDRGLVGIQFHPDVVHTAQGKALLENFLYRLCGCSGDWTSGNFIADLILR